MTAIVIRANARTLPLPDASVDLIVTSPPYFGLRSYTDTCNVCLAAMRDGIDPRTAFVNPSYDEHVRRHHHYDGQIGSEATPAEFLAALLACTRDWIRVLKPSGSIFVNLGDKYATRYSSVRGGGRAGLNHDDATRGRSGQNHSGAPEKSLMGLPWRYALACMDQTAPQYRADFLGGLLGDVLDGTIPHDTARERLAEFDASPKSRGLGLILRAEIIWAKPNGLPESVTDRVRRSHEQVFHFTRQPRYYSAVDEVREPTAEIGRKPKSVKAGALAGSHGSAGHDGNGMRMAEVYNNPLGKLPGSVWEIPSAPLTVPARLGVDHFAAYPPELCRRIILGWSPPGICTACGEGRRPVAVGENIPHATRSAESQAFAAAAADAGRSGFTRDVRWMGERRVNITGYACACTPYTDHPERRRPSVTPGRALGRGHQDNAARAEQAGSRHHGDDWPERLPAREYHFDRWTAPPTRPAVVLDPFGGTGTTALVASVLGRNGISADLSHDYCRLAAWRTTDPAERARALGVAKPPPVADGQEALFEAVQ